MATIRQLLEQLYTDWQLQERKTIPKMRMHAQHIERYFGRMHAETLKQQHLQAYQIARKSAGAAAGTINLEMRILRRAFRLAYEAEEIDKVPVFRMLKEQNVRQGTYSLEDVTRLLAELPAHQRPVVRYAYLTGRRKEEILALRWEDVDLKGRKITVRLSTTKTGEPDVIPLEGELMALLLELWAQRQDGCPLVFHRRGKPIGDFRESFTKALARAGLPDRIFHDFRRTVATDLIEAGVPESVAMRITGHKSNSVFQRYNIVRSKPVREAMATLAEYRQLKGE